MLPIVAYLSRASQSNCVYRYTLSIHFNDGDNSESTDDGRFSPITVEEYQNFFPSVRLAKRMALTIYVQEF